MNKNVILNIGTNRAWYPKGRKRLLDSLEGKFDGDIISWTDEKDIPSPTHLDVPYAFKPYGFFKAKDLGYKNAFWADSSAICVKNVKPIFDEIEKCGYFMIQIGDAAHRWTNDNALKYFGVTREEVIGVPLFMAGMVGFDLTNDLSLEFLKRWKHAADHGAFNGSWKDHRHDLACGSIIAWQLGIKFHLMSCDWCPYIGKVYGKPKESAIFHMQGM